jgi:HEPN domain-containing protein
MPPSADKPRIPLRWLDNARADLAMARAPLPSGATYEMLCFHAQQAAEKALKAVLLHVEVDFPFTHDLAALMALLPNSIARPVSPPEVVDLNPYAVTTRYPGELEAVTTEEYREALRTAEGVVEWAESILAGD